MAKFAPPLKDKSSGEISFEVLLCRIDFENSISQSLVATWA